MRRCAARPLSARTGLAGRKAAPGKLLCRRGDGDEHDAGFYTLAATSIQADELPPDILKRLPRYPLLPAALVGRLAVDQRFHRKGLGGALLADAALRVLKGDVKALAIIVEAKDENAVAFYRLQGFQPFASRPLSLFLPLGTVKKGAAAS